MGRPRLIVLGLVLLTSGAIVERADGQSRPDAALVAGAITAEATRPNGAATGLPLPLAGHWNVGSRPGGFNPDWQIATIQQGHYLLPWFAMPVPDREQRAEYYRSAVTHAARLKLPISFVSTQWERLLTDDRSWSALPADGNPNVVGTDGKIKRMVSPFSPVEPWRQVGRKWTATAMLKRIQQWYPDPPLVVFISNNEHAKLRWHQVEQSKRYLDRYGKGKDDDFKRRIVAAGWIERYRALQGGMRDGLDGPTWKKSAIFVGYDAFGPPHFARWGGWMDYSLYCGNRIDPWALAWDGASPSFYVHNWNPSTDYTVWGPQVESMNWIFMLDEAFRLNPNLWWEISVWDGHEPTKDSDMRKTYARRGQTYSPRRYAGLVQFGMWLTRPRVVREFRGWTDTVDKAGPYFSRVLAAIDRVHRDRTLRAFWRKGTLVANRARVHPYQVRVPAEYKDKDRWFLLDTNLSPEPPLKLDTPIPVFAMARVLGRAPERQWLIYAHAPLGEEPNVSMTLPDYGVVKGDVSVAGSFFLIDEKGKTTRPIP